MDFLYGKIGGKLKGLAIASAIIGAIASVISGIAMISNDEDLAGWGLLTIFGGVVASWILSWVVYGIGEMNCKMDILLSDGKRDLHSKNNDPIERIKKLDSLRAKGLISEEEYQNALNKQ